MVHLSFYYTQTTTLAEGFSVQNLMSKHSRMVPAILFAQGLICQTVHTLWMAIAKVLIMEEAVRNVNSKVPMTRRLNSESITAESTVTCGFKTKLQIVR